MTEKKDGWDKLDIVAKPMIAIIAAFVIWVWNMDRTQQQTAATMSQIAVGILAEPITEERNDPLREWAVSVLQNPSDPPRLSDEAAEKLMDRPLNSILNKNEYWGSVQSFSDLINEFDLRNSEQPRALGDDLLE